MLSRRLFLSILGSAAAFDPERLLWMPGKKVISVPALRRKELRYFGRDVELGASVAPTFWGSRPCRSLCRELEDLMLEDIHARAAAEMTKPTFVELSLPFGVDRALVWSASHTGLSFRQQMEPNVMIGKLVVRVDCLVEM
jgi:hypothetical protein